MQCLQCRRPARVARRKAARNRPLFRGSVRGTPFGFGILPKGTCLEHMGILISHRLWQRRWNGDPSAVGKRVIINGHSFTIVGVAAEGFRGCVLPIGHDLWVPIQRSTAAAAITRRSPQRPAICLAGWARRTTQARCDPCSSAGRYCADWRPASEGPWRVGCRHGERQKSIPCRR